VDRDLLREFVSSVLAEVAIDPSSAAKKGLGLAVFEQEGERKMLVLFPAKKAAEAIVTTVKSGKKDANSFMDALENVIVGVIALAPGKKAQQWGAMSVQASAAQKGYGPLLYDAAMTLFGKITADRRHVSPSAEKVWRYYADNRKDVQKFPFDDVEDPKTPTPKDDAELHHDGDAEALNAAYSGAKIDISGLKKNADKWFAWADASGLDRSTISTALRHAGSGFFRRQYLS
jgi:hypothetical protein